MDEAPALFLEIAVDRPEGGRPSPLEPFVGVSLREIRESLEANRSRRLALARVMEKGGARR